jgi:hypothetical protein
VTGLTLAPNNCSCEEAWESQNWHATFGHNLFGRQLRLTTRIFEVLVTVQRTHMCRIFLPKDYGHPATMWSNEASAHAMLTDAAAGAL